MSQSDFAAPSRLGRWSGWLRGRRTGWVVGGLALVAALYYPVGMVLTHRIDGDIAFAAPAENGASHAIAVTAALIERETDQYVWTAN